MNQRRPAWVDLAEVFELHAARRTKVLYEKRSLDDVNASIEDVEKGRVSGRLVFDLSGGTRSRNAELAAVASR